MKTYPWHCAQKYMGWLTYCGLDLQHRASPSRKREFKWHADRNTFLYERGRKCATCTTAARNEKTLESRPARALSK
jgi:hypothetical protein